MDKILLMLAHPRFEKSRANRALIHAVQDLPFVTIHDLYELYPDFNIDIAREHESASAASNHYLAVSDLHVQPSCHFKTMDGSGT